MSGAFVVDGVRSPRGKAKDKGGLHGTRPVELISVLINALAERHGINPNAIDDLILGCVTQVGDQGCNIARTGAAFAGLRRVPGLTVQGFCASGLDAIQHGSMLIETGRAHLVLAGGVESMSRVPMFSDKGAYFADPVVADKAQFVHMGVAADALATRANISRQQLDDYAWESHQRAARSHAEGRPHRSMVPIAGLDRDELFRADLSTEKLASLAPAFADIPRPDFVGAIEARHTVATSPGMCDGASLMLLASESALKSHGLSARARLVTGATACADPADMLTGNIEATEAALDRSGITSSEISVFEINESFAAVPIHFAKHFAIGRERIAPNGGALALGHPLGATGGYLAIAGLDELDRTGSRYAVASVCGAAGLATALVFERL